METSIFDNYTMEGLNNVIEEWKTIKENSHLLKHKIVLPNYFLAINPEIATEYIIDLISSKLEELSLMEFSSNLHSYLYTLTYSGDNENDFISFRKFYEIFTLNLSKYGKTFEGILSIDISEWIENEACNSKKFLAFLDFMSSIDNQTMALFVSRCTNVNKNKKAFQMLLTKSRIRMIEIGEVSDKKAYEYIEKKFLDSGFVILNEAKQSIKTISSFILNVAGNEGIKSLHQFVDEVIYDKMASKTSNNNEINSSDLEKYLPDSEWSMLFKNTRNRYLGIIGGDDNE